MKEEWKPINTAPRDGTWFRARTECGTVRTVHFDNEWDRLPTSHDGEFWVSAPIEWATLPNLEYRVRMLQKALDLALGYAVLSQPGDSRAVDDWFVACAAVSCELDDTDGRIEQCLDDEANRLRYYCMKQRSQQS